MLWQHAQHCNMWDFSLRETAGGSKSNDDSTEENIARVAGCKHETENPPPWNKQTSAATWLFLRVKGAKCDALGGVEPWKFPWAQNQNIPNLFRARTCFEVLLCCSHSGASHNGHDTPWMASGCDYLITTYGEARVWSRMAVELVIFFYWSVVRMEANISIRGIVLLVEVSFSLNLSRDDLKIKARTKPKCSEWK